MSRCAYQRSIARIAAKLATDVRYPAAQVAVTLRTCLREKPLLRAAIVKLVASRLTSHSHGPGSVSSKSLRSNSSWRSGEP